MGQYYMCVNVDKKEYIEPDMSKLMEHSWVGNEAPSKAMELLEPGNRWCGDRIIWVGDYAYEEVLDKDGNYFGKVDLEDQENFRDSLMEYVEDERTEAEYIKLCDVDNKDFLGDKVWDRIEFEKIPENEVEEVQNRELKKVLVNHTKKEYVLMNETIRDENGMIAHPLPLLTASGNGRGGGDYRSGGLEYVGRWSGDSLSVEDEIPEEYEKVNVKFVEKLGGING